jgi:hypothetical protein
MAEAQWGYNLVRMAVKTYNSMSQKGPLFSMKF